MSYSSSETTSVPATDTNIDKVTNGQVTQVGPIASGVYDGTQTQVENLFEKINEIGDSNSREKQTTTNKRFLTGTQLGSLAAVGIGVAMANPIALGIGIVASIANAFFLYSAINKKGKFSDAENKRANYYNTMYNNALDLRNLVASEEHQTQKVRISNSNEAARLTDESTQKRLKAKLEEKDFVTFMDKSRTISNRSADSKDIASNAQSLLNSLDDLKQMNSLTNDLLH